MNNTVDAQRFYRETAVRGATPIELVVILYDTALEDMRRAVTAMRRADIESRAKCIGHALIVLQQLQGTLDFDGGGPAARQFEQFYNLIRAKLLEAQIRGSAELMQEQIRCFSEVRDCWMQANRALQPKPVVVATPTGEAAVGGGSRSEWNA